MTTKTRRIEMRADPESEQRISAAAELAHQSVSSFVLGAALSEADRLLAGSEVTLMAPEQFDALLSSLEVAEAAPELARLASSPRPFRRG
ncbi:MAG: DUF1778 domain-containing protein [Acidimicrobiales bacterium]